MCFSSIVFFLSLFRTTTNLSLDIAKEEAKVKTADVSKILTEVKGMKETQDNITGKLDSMKR